MLIVKDVMVSKVTLNLPKTNNMDPKAGLLYILNSC